ncbi:enoyl-CoA hydratase [uncultured Roseobacter sp.]|uniref:enoyl-CoA hydratase n=1 Tax=uncultured Roseobacter sp. TaxID=114847 RepID=UPI002618D113|nr:enoyl-CoA hydratase [uncultured Roseobacter sp.]
MHRTLPTFAEGKLLVEREGATGRIIFNKPDRLNAMSLDMWDGLRDALAFFAEDDDIRAVVLSGAGERAFVSGADITEFDAMRSTDEGIQDYNARYEGADAALYTFPKPTIAQIHGFCVGGGLAIALSCDIRICAQGTRMGIPAAKLGLGYGYAGVRRLRSVAGPAIASEILFSARLFEAEEALRHGLVNRVVPQDDLAEEVSALATTIAANAPLTVEAAKAAIRMAGSSEAESAADQMNARATACSKSEDYAEGRLAFAEKRHPVFRRR